MSLFLGVLLFAVLAAVALHMILTVFLFGLALTVFIAVGALRLNLTLRSWARRVRMSAKPKTPNSVGFGGWE